MRIATTLFIAFGLLALGCNGDDPAGTTMAECPTDAGSTPTTDGGAGVDAGPMLDGGGYFVPTAFLGGGPTRGVGADTMTTAGADFQLNCDAGKVVTGFEALSSTAQIWGFAIRCGELRTVKFDEGSFEVRTGGASAGMLVGTQGDGSTNERGDCGPNMFARGIYGKNDGSRVYALGLLCGEAEVAGDDHIDVIGASNSSFFGGGAGMMFDIACPENTVLTGINGRADADPVSGGVLRIGAYCAAAMVVD
jgi:hypothetical protein